MTPRNPSRITSSLNAASRRAAAQNGGGAAVRAGQGATSGATRRARRVEHGGVLHLCADLDYGDPARETVSLAIMTQRADWRAVIASAGGSLVIEAERAAVRHARVPLDQTGRLALWRNRVQMETIVQRERPMLLHAHGAAPIDLACRVARQHRLPLLIDLTQPLPADRPQHKLMTQVAQTPCLIRVPSSAMADYLVRTFDINKGLIYCVPPGIDLQTFNTQAISAERLRNLARLWRLPEQAIVALVPLPLEPQMGHDGLLRALVTLKDENLYAVLVGDDRFAPGLRRQLEQSIETLGLGGRVVMPDSCADWPAAFWLANVVVASNAAMRGQNVELLAAQAVGRPVIVTATGANEEMVHKGETAWVVPPGDDKALARALRAAIRMTPQQRVSLADNARFFIEEHFPQSAWFDGIASLYQRLLQPAVRAA